MRWAPVGGTWSAPSVGFSQHGVVYLDEQVEKHDPRVLQNGAPRGPQQCVGEIAAFGRGQDFKLDEHLSHGSTSQLLERARPREITGASHS